MVVVLEYALAAGSVANVLEIEYTLAIQTVSSIADDNWFAYLIWSFGAIGVHAFSCLSFRLRFRIEATNEKHGDIASRKRSVLEYIRQEFTPAAYANPPNLERSRRTLAFLVVAWFTEIGTMVNLFWGTIAFSAVQFLGSRDATVIVFRYLASIVCCRMVVAYEIAGLRQAYAGRSDRQVG